MRLFGLDWIGLNWVGLSWIRLDWIGLNSIGLNSIGLNSIKSDWNLRAIYMIVGLNKCQFAKLYFANGLLIALLPLPIRTIPADCFDSFSMDNGP